MSHRRGLEMEVYCLRRAFDFDEDSPRPSQPGPVHDRMRHHELMTRVQSGVKHSM